VTDVSVIVPVYNAAPYLGKCLDSLASQTLENIEVILIVDEGTKDNSGDIVDEFVASHTVRFSAIRMPHATLGEARNYGATLARAEFIEFVDADDFVEPDFCEVPLLAAKREAADIVAFRARMITKIRGTERIIESGFSSGTGPRQAMLQTTVLAWNKLYRKSFVDASGGFRYPACFHEDLCETPRLFANEPRAIALDDILYDYVRRGDSASGLGPNKNDLDLLPVCRKLLEYAEEYPRYAAEFEYIVEAQLRGLLGTWKESHGDWVAGGRETAQKLYGSLRPRFKDNPYIIMDRLANPGLSGIVSYIGRSARSRAVKSIKKMPRLFSLFERMKFGIRKE
jgi:glycosyltransferase involved in cell wall biosynthesis